MRRTKKGGGGETYTRNSEIIVNCFDVEGVMRWRKMNGILDAFMESLSKRSESSGPYGKHLASYLSTTLSPMVF